MTIEQVQVGVKVLLENERGEFLFLHRKEAHPDGTGIRWDIPGGRITPGEPTLEALNREVHEETGLALTSTPRLLAAQDIIVPEKGFHVVRLTYLAKVSGEPNISHEHQNHQWATLEEGRKLHVDRFLQEVLEAEG